jgi:uncharacterized membrane protein
MDKPRPMTIFYLSISLAILSTLFYHICQKSTPANANPAFALLVTYIVSAVLCILALLFLFPAKASLFSEFRKLNWASFILGLALVGIELSTLLAYRAGWKVSVTALVINVTAAILLIPVGYFIFKDKISLVNGIGIVICIIGLVMINLKQ